MKYSTRIRNAPCIAIPNRNIATLEALKLRILKRLKSTIGSETLLSTMKTSKRAISAPAKSESTGVEVQPQSLPWMIANTRQNIAVLKVSKPSGSNFLLVPASRVSGTKIATIIRPTIQNGRLTKKIQRQSKFCTRKPPRTGPAAAANPDSAPQTPIAAPRRSRGKTAMIIARLTGFNAAAPIAWNALKPISQLMAGQPVSEAMVGESAHNKDPRLKIIIPNMNIRLRPYWSAKRPIVTSSIANTRLYAFKTHVTVVRFVFKLL